MKIFSLFFLASILLDASFLRPQDSPELKEASTLSESAVKLFDEKKYDQAVPLAKKALQIRERLLPPTDPRIAISLYNLGALYLVKENNDAAKDIFERLLKLQEERTAPDHVSLAPITERLAILYYRQGHNDKAEDMFKRTLTLRERAFGSGSPSVAESLLVMGHFYRHKRDFDSAEASYRRSMSIYAKVSGFDSPEFERAIDGFTCLAYETNDTKLIKEEEEMRKLTVSPALAALLKGAILNGKALSLPKPDYPAEARARNLAGLVMVKVDVDEAGRVINATDLCQGPRYLSESAVKAAWQARFRPTIVSGVPLKVKGYIRYKFVRQ